MTRSDFPAASWHSGMWEAFSPRALGSPGLWPGRDTHWIYGPLGQPRLGGALSADSRLTVLVDSDCLDVGGGTH